MSRHAYRPYIPNPRSMMFLSPREVQMIEYVALGLTAKQIARRTGIEFRTVQSYLSAIKRKLRARNMPQAIFLACRAGFL